MPTAGLDLELRVLIEALSAGRLEGRNLAPESIRRARGVAGLNCFIELFEADDAGSSTPSWAIGEARLRGVPFAVKDVFRWAGREPTGGSVFRDLLEGAPPSPVIESLTRLGAQLIGATNLDEICYGMTGINPHFGPVRNPWDPSRISGGSSSGAAAAVAARVVPFAVASDTGGSIRVPAALCGVTGFKPTLGTLSTDGVVLLSATQDSLGFIARSAADCALLLALLTKRDASFIADDAGPPANLLGGLRVGVIRHPFFEGMAAAVTTAFRAALDVLRSLGARVAYVDNLDLQSYDADAAIITGFEAAQYHRRRIQEQFASFSGPSQIRLAAARKIPPEIYATALNRHRHLVAHPPVAFAQCDVLVSPTVLDIAPRIEALSEDAAASVDYTISLLRCTRPFNYLGTPTVSLPMGFSADGLPLGMQMIGAVRADARVLFVAQAFQAATDWHTASPPPAGTGLTGRIGREPGETQ